MTEIKNDCLRCKNCECQKKEESKLCTQCGQNEKMNGRKICYECKKLWLKQYYIDKLKEKHPKSVGRPKIEKEPKEKKTRGRPKKEKQNIIKKSNKSDISEIYNNDELFDLSSDTD